MKSANASVDMRARPVLPPFRTRVLEAGHHDCGSLNDLASDKHFVSRPLNSKAHQTTLGIFLCAVLIPTGAIFVGNKFHEWKVRSDAAAAQAVADAMATKQAQILEAMRSADEKSKSTFAEFVTQGIANVQIPSTPSASAFNGVSMTSWNEIFWAIKAGNPPAVVQKMTVGQPWSKPLQYLVVQPETVLLSAVIEVDGTRKAWYGLVHDTRSTGSGSPHQFISLANVPGVSPGKLYLPPELESIEFSNVLQLAIDAVKKGEK